MVVSWLHFPVGTEQHVVRICSATTKNRTERHEMATLCNSLDEPESLAPQVAEETRSYFERKPWIENAEKHRYLKQTGQKSH